MGKYKKITVQNVEISIVNINDSNYSCLTDMMKAKDGGFFVSDWLRNRNTLEYIGAWASLNNPDFNDAEFALIKEKSGLSRFRLGVKEWRRRTSATGIIAKAGRYGGTYAHEEIAFNFGMWIRPVFQLYIVKAYQRLKEIEHDKYGLEWNVKRILSKANYRVHTAAIENYIIPKSSFNQEERLLYAGEADLLNVVLFGCTVKAWEEANPERHLKGENIRGMVSINELVISSNAESLTQC